MNNNTHRLLLVDDNPDNLRVLDAVISGLLPGMELLYAPNAETGIAKAQENHIDGAIIDVQMPGMNGFQATRQLSRDPVTAQIPVILVTTKSEDTDRIWGMRQGAVDYIVKPVTEDDLLSKARAALSQ